MRLALHAYHFHHPSCRRNRYLGYQSLARSYICQYNSYPPTTEGSPQVYQTSLTFLRNSQFLPPLAPPSYSAIDYRHRFHPTISANIHHPRQAETAHSFHSFHSITLVIPRRTPKVHSSNRIQFMHARVSRGGGGDPHSADQCRNKDSNPKIQIPPSINDHYI